MIKLLKAAWRGGFEGHVGDGRELRVVRQRQSELCLAVGLVEARKREARVHRLELRRRHVPKTLFL
jgi:hypothetical protein